MKVVKLLCASMALWGLGAIGVANAGPLNPAICATTTTCDGQGIPEAEFACQIVNNFTPVVQPACVATIQSANDAYDFVVNQGYARVGTPVVRRVCETAGGANTLCLTVSAEVLYSIRGDSAVVLCHAYADGATTVDLDCGGTPGIAVVPTSTAITPEIPGATGNLTVTAKSHGYRINALGVAVAEDQETSFNVAW